MNAFNMSVRDFSLLTAKELAELTSEEIEVLTRGFADGDLMFMPGCEYGRTPIEERPALLAKWRAEGETIGGAYMERGYMLRTTHDGKLEGWSTVSKASAVGYLQYKHEGH